MRDCPACKVPLHGYEDVCPSCGTQQYPKANASSRGPYGTNFKPQEPSVNWMPFILVFIVGAICLLFMVQGTWIGQVLRGENKLPDDPLAQMTTMDARTVIETELNKNLEANGGGGAKIEWKANTSDTDSTQAVDARSVDGPVDVTITARLPSKDLIPQIVDPIKPYMEKAKIFSLTFTETGARATRTYNLQIPITAPDEETAAE